MENAFVGLYHSELKREVLNLGTYVLCSAVTFVPVSTVNGRAEADDVLAAVRPATCLVTIMLANNETGVVMVSRSFPSHRPGGKGRSALLVHSSPAGPLPLLSSL